MSELSDWQKYVLPGLLKDARSEGRGEVASEIERLLGWLAFIEGGAGLTGDAARAAAAAAIDGKAPPTGERE